MAWLKNTFVTAAMVVGATMATAIVVILSALALAVEAAPAMSDLNTVAYAISGAIIGGMFFGGFFAFVSLPVAAVTMPPAIGLIRLLKLPRPLFDIFGGGAAGLICAAAFMAILHSFEQAKGGNMSSEIQPMLDIVAMLGGGALGYLRHAALVRSKPAPVTAAMVTAPVTELVAPG